ncbi:hypothetical protein SK128_014756, partial [Halocaridina rubra]
VAAEMANGSGKKCMEVDVEEHVTCGCRCSMSQEQCKGEEVSYSPAHEEYVLSS